MAALVLPAIQRSATKPLRLRTHAHAFLEDVDPLPIALGDGVHCRLARDSARAPLDQCIPERRAPHGEADEPGDAGGGHEPRAHLACVLAATQGDAHHFPTTVAPCRGDEIDAVLASVHALDFP